MSTYGPVDYPELPSTAYLTGASCPLTRAAHRTDLGLLVTPASSIHRQLPDYELWGADNGLYVESKRGNDFDPARWLRWLTELPRRDALFAALPDVLEWHFDDDGKLFPVGNLEATIERSAGYVDAVKELGYPAAIVAQDGLRSIDQLPFEVDAVFVGGSDDYKLGPDVVELAADAHDRGLWVHVGRVNSLKRLRYCADVIKADSADGTKIAFGPDVNAPKVIGWLDTLAAEKNEAEALAA